MIVNREAPKISTLPLSKIDKYEFLIGEEMQAKQEIEATKK